MSVWFVTGAARGMGAAFVEAALDAGHQVVATARQPQQVTDLFGERGDLLPVRLDVTSQPDADAAVAAAVDRYGRIDVVVNSAGASYKGYFEEMSPRQVEQQLAVNLLGPMNVTRAVLSVMREQRSGHLIAISSGAGLVGFEFSSVYAASKSGLEGWMGALAQEVAPFGIRTTIVNPGFFRTGLASPESLVWPEVAVDDYAERSAAQREWWLGQDGRQPGDPAKLAQALLTIAGEDPPPTRFIAGADVIALAERRIADLRAQIDSHRLLSTSLTVDEFANTPDSGTAGSTEDPFVHELWVRGHDGERGVLSHNPHTHPGRFSVLWESTGDTHATSLSQLADMSPLARAWLAGYLFGNEPEPWEVLGKDPDDDITDDEYDVWWEELAEFRRTGGMVLPIRDN